MNPQRPADRQHHEEAISVREQDVSRLCEELGEDHLDVAAVRASLGEALHRAGRLAAAEVAYTAALETRELALGPHHPDLGPTLLILAQLAAERGDPRTGSIYARRAAVILDGYAVRDPGGAVLTQE